MRLKIFEPIFCLVSFVTSISLGKRGEKKKFNRPSLAGVARFMPSRKQKKRAHKQVAKVNSFVSNVVECIDDWFFAARDESENLQESARKGGGPIE